MIFFILALEKVKLVISLMPFYLISPIIVINAVLSLILKRISKKKGFDKGSYIVIPSVCKKDSYLFLKKQRIKYLHCNSSFVCKTDLVNYGCFISNITKHSIAVDLTKKRSEKDIAIDNNVSPNTVQKVLFLL